LKNLEENQINIINYKMSFVINPIDYKELSTFLDDKSKSIIRYFIIKSLFSQPEPMQDQKQLPIQIPEEHIEQWFTQALDVKSVGAGSYPIDIYNEREHWGADIKMLNLKVSKTGEITGGDSGETSLAQNFKEAGIDLDNLFSTKNYEEIKARWITLYKRKYDQLKTKYPLINKVYYFFILRPSIQSKTTDFYFCAAVLDLNKLDNVLVDTQRTKRSSVFLDNFIDKDFGNTKIYKAKKRLELRLKPKSWIANRKVIRITTSFGASNVNLRDHVIDSEYLHNETERLKNITVDFILE